MRVLSLPFRGLTVDLKFGNATWCNLTDITGKTFTAAISELQTDPVRMLRDLLHAAILAHYQRNGMASDFEPIHVSDFMDDLPPEQITQLMSMMTEGLSFGAEAEGKKSKGAKAAPSPSSSITEVQSSPE